LVEVLPQKRTDDFSHWQPVAGGMTLTACHSSNFVTLLNDIHSRTSRSAMRRSLRKFMHDFGLFGAVVDSVV